MWRKKERKTEEREEDKEEDDKIRRGRAMRQEMIKRKRKAGMRRKRR